MKSEKSCFRRLFDSLAIYLAYKVNTQPVELYYSGSPISLAIAGYDPLQTSSAALQTLDTSFVDAGRNRSIPLLVFLPASTAPAPVVLFSHGLGGNRFTAVYLGEHWLARGYLVVFMQHPGSDETILEGVPASQILSVMSAAASAENHVARIGDVSAVINQLEIWNKQNSHVLKGSMDLNRIGMSGHSFGARTTQTTSGEIVPWLNYSTRDPRIKAAMPLSTAFWDTWLLGDLSASQWLHSGSARSVLAPADSWKLK